MMEFLSILLRIAGLGLILLAIMHIPVGKQLNWKEDIPKLTPANAEIFHVHTFFICLTLVLMGLPSLLDPEIFLKRTRPGAWLAWIFAVFWGFRLYFQCFVYSPDLWRGKRLETSIHWLFTFLWLALTAVYGACGAIQAGWLE